MSFEIKPASRTAVKPLVGFYGKSGSGKTLSALLFARGLVGEKGRIALIDSENGRGSIFADMIPGGYLTLELDAPFSPGRYEEAIATAEGGADVIVVDSISHEWSGEGGVLDWAEAELERLGGKDSARMASWIKPKMAHKMMVMRLLRCKLPLICCLRGDEKTHMAKGASGKAQVITDEFSSPLFDSRFIFEMLLNFETVAHNGVGGYVIPRKITHPDIGRLLPGPDEQIGIKHGRALAAWCAALAAPASAIKAKPVDDPLKAAKGRLWKLCQPLLDADKTVPALEAKLRQLAMLPAERSLQSLVLPEVQDLIDKIEIELGQRNENA